MRRRLDLAASLVADPPVLFLDEPTSGLDPVSRTAMWQAIRDLAAAGTTVLLTTQHLEEADQLANEIVVISGGVVAAPAPDGLASLAAAITRLEATGAAIHQAGLEHPTLDEVFGTLTSETRPENQDRTGTRDGRSRRLETTAS